MTRLRPNSRNRYLESIVLSSVPVTGRLLRLTAFALAGMLVLMGGATLVGANPASTDSISPSILLPPRLQSGLGRAAHSDRSVGLAQNHVAYVRRPASVTERRLVAGGPPPSPPTATSPGPGLPVDLPVSAPARPPGLKSVPAPEPTPSPPAPEPPPSPAPDPDPPPVVSPPDPPPVVTPPVPPPVVVPPDPAPPALLEADFEDGLSGWNTAGVGDVVPRVTMDIVRDGTKSSAIKLTGEQDRSELILGGNGGGSTAGTIQFREGDEYFYGFSFYIETMVYGEPGAHNLIMQFKSNDGGSPNFGLQLWDYAGDDLVIHFKASSVDAGFYEVYLDGTQIDSRSGVSMIVPGAAYAYIKDGLYRNGAEIPGTSEIRLDAAKLGDTMASVLPE